MAILTIDLRNNPGYDEDIHHRLVLKMSKNIRNLFQQYKRKEYTEDEFEQLKEFIDITDGAYEKEELVTMENNILKILNFNIVSPTPNDFFNIISKAFNFDQKQNYLGRYFLESALIDYQMIKFSPSVIAVSCAYIVMKYFGISNYKILYTNDFVREECPQKAIKDTARTIYFLVKNLSQSSLKAVKDKYSLSQFLNVAQYCELK